MARKKKTPVEKEHPALMPKLAWQQLVKSLMAEHGLKHQYSLAEAIGVCDQTISRWLGKKPALPEPDSFEKVAAFLKVSGEELSQRWFSLMGERFGYQQQPSAASEVREPAAAYHEPDPLVAAKALEGLDLQNAPPEQRPFLHNHRREILELVAEVEEIQRRLALRLRSMLKSFRDLFQSAADTERRTSSVQGG